MATLKLKERPPVTAMPVAPPLAEYELPPHLEGTPIALALDDYRESPTVEAARNLIGIIDEEVAAARNHLMSEDKYIDTRFLPLGGTTDLIIRQQQQTVLLDLNFEEVLELIRNGDAETARAMWMPPMRKKFDMPQGSPRWNQYRAVVPRAALKDPDSYYQAAATIRAGEDIRRML